MSTPPIPKHSPPAAENGPPASQWPAAGHAPGTAQQPEISRPDPALNAARDHAVLAAALDPIITIDAYGVIQSASNSVERVFGWLPSELLGRNISILMPEPHRSAHDGYLANYRRTGLTNILGRTREFEGARRNGESFPIELSVSRVDPPGGGLPLFVGIIRDITHRKRLERELRLVQDLALSISGTSSLAGAFVETIRQIAQATGWDYGEVWTRSPDGAELVGGVSWSAPGSHLEDFAGTMCCVRFRPGVGLPGRAWATRRPVWAGDITILGEQEFCRPAAARQAGLRAAVAVPILSENEVFAVLLFFVRQTRPEDVHLLELVQAAVAPLGTLMQRKHAEDELDQYRRHLEQKVEQRTHALQESQEKLRMADRLASIGTLAAGLGHDMNNVLLPVRAHLNALRAEAEAGDLSAAARKHLDAIRKSTAYLQQLADGLHFLAMDPEKQDNLAEATDLALWWAQAGVLLGKAVPRHVKVKASLPRDLPPVAVSAAGLTQAVLNLVVNSGEAIPTGRKRVQGAVRIAATAEPGGRRVRLSVSDNGTGMTDEVKRRAFEMFFTTKVRGLGTGLGLALVRKVAEGAGGAVAVESELGRGTTVTMILPTALPLHAQPSDSGPEPRLLPPTAIVSISDGRSAALVRHLLEATGAAAGIGEHPADADIWILEPRLDRLQDARNWLDRRPQARLVLFGAPEPASAPAWGGLSHIAINAPDDFELVRAAVGRAVMPA